MEVWSNRTTEEQPLGRSRRPAALLLACCLVLLLPRAASAWSVCVAPQGEVPDNAEDCVDGTFADFESALAAVQGLPAGEAYLRLLGDAESEPHAESLIIDVRGQGLDLAIEFNSRALCPSPDSPPGTPVVELISDGSFFVNRLTIDIGPGGPCPTEQPGLLLWGGGYGTAHIDLAGWTGWGLTNGLLPDFDSSGGFGPVPPRPVLSNSGYLAASNLATDLPRHAHMGRDLVA